MARRWLDVLIVCALPTLVLYRPGRGWLLGSPFSRSVWSVLGAAALVGVLGLENVFPNATPPSDFLLIATPLLQALAFVLLDWLFGLGFGRAPVSYDEARYGHTPEGEIYWLDRMFWLVVLLGMTAGGLILCVSFGVKFPSRSGAS